MFLRNCWYVAAWDYELKEAGRGSRALMRKVLSKLIDDESFARKPQVSASA
jgi:hypothetical protein